MNSSSVCLTLNRRGNSLPTFQTPSGTRVGYPLHLGWTHGVVMNYTRYRGRFQCGFEDTISAFGSESLFMT
jgi:hypothetical protein